LLSSASFSRIFVGRSRFISYLGILASFYEGLISSRTLITIQFFFFRIGVGCQFWGIVETLMETSFFGNLGHSHRMPADGKHRVKFDPLQFIHEFGAMAEISTPASAITSRRWDESVRFDPANGLDPIAEPMPRPAFGHLAAAGVSGTKNENFGFHRVPSITARVN
jgi:hypothetical protein